MKFDCEEYFKIIASIENDCRGVVQARRNQHRESKSFRFENRYFWFVVVGFSGFAMFTAVIWRVVGWHWLMMVSWGSLFLSYVALLFYPVIGVVLYRDSLRKVLRAPFSSLVELNVKSVMQIDAQHLTALRMLSIETLKLGVLELKNERASFEKRTYMVAGALDKVGIFPGLLALAVGISSMVKLFDGTGLTIHVEWIFILAVANVFFFMLSGYVQMMLMKYDRMIAVTELAIDFKKGGPKGPRSQAVMQS